MWRGITIGFGDVQRVFAKKIKKTFSSFLWGENCVGGQGIIERYQTFAAHI